ncbi:hypothetical protein [Calothrix sp. UHCC 0171]|uniref:hypothetical protein n=1 Tax=Calothrix sp. UHCC 0171 TaxID=3110245 RepID=UPI002B210B8D|nr:hypothetical protein [Calothrix sp. UHCC 0171]MEA5569930.1 hypothetical protein [Calothrix sp. UHCC 0171]
MLTEIFPFSFEIDKIAIAGTTLWSLALYLGLSSLSEKIIELLNRWFNFAEGFLYVSKEEFEKTRKARESQNAFYASVFSIVPFLAVGALVNWLLDLGLGGSWGISTGILACMGCGVYELGRRTAQSEEE